MTAIVHQGLFTLIALTAVAELALTAFLLAKGSGAQTHGYHGLLIFMSVNAGWTFFFGVAYTYWIVMQTMHFLASVATSFWWLVITTALWGIATGVFHNARTDGICDGLPPVSRCRESLTVEGLGWAEFGLCLFTILATWLWVMNEADEGSWRGSWVEDRAREPSV